MFLWIWHALWLPLPYACYHLKKYLWDVASQGARKRPLGTSLVYMSIIRITSVYSSSLDTSLSSVSSFITSSHCCLIPPCTMIRWVCFHLLCLLSPYPCTMIRWVFFHILCLLSPLPSQPFFMVKA